MYGYLFATVNPLREPTGVQTRENSASAVFCLHEPVVRVGLSETDK